jgi:glycosyltransferase involved in cell wall biosynthesis
MIKHYNRSSLSSPLRLKFTPLLLNMINSSQDAQIEFITVVFNGEKLLEETILSVINLSEKYKVSHIIIDGYSTDKTVDIIKQYQDHLKYWISEPDSGLYEAMNKGWAAASPDSYILFLGAGDLIYSVPQLSIDSKHKAIFGTVKRGEHQTYKSSISSKIEIGNTLHHQALLLHKSLHLDPPFNTQYRICADYEFNLRLYLKPVEFTYSEDLIAYALPGGVSQTAIAAIEMLDIVEKYFGKRKRFAAYWTYGISIMILDIWTQISRQFDHSIE